MTEIRLDDILTKIGSFGRYQRTLCCSFGYGGLLNAFIVMSPIFVLGLPDHRCAIPGLLNDTFELQGVEHVEELNRSRPSESQCTIYDVNGTEVPCKRWVYDETYFKPSAVSEFDLVCKKTVYRSLANMSYMFGLLFGGLLCGYLSDRFGRKKVMCGCLTVQTIVVFAMAFVPEFLSYVALRCISGAVDIGYYGAAIVWCIEFAGPSMRDYAGFGVNFFYGFGAVIFTLIPYLLPNWRHIYITMGAFFVVTFPYWWLLPESPRWLLVNNRRKEMAKTLQTTARVNRKTLGEEELAAIKLEDTALKKENFLHLLKHKKLAMRLLIVCSNWLAAVTAYFGLSLNAGNLVGNLYVNYLVSALAELPAYVFVVVAPKKFGRIKPHMFTMILGGASCVLSIFQVIFGDESTSWTLTVLSMIGKFGATAAFATVFVLGAEMSPTTLRVIYMGICSMFARVGGMVAPLISDMGKLVPGKYSDAVPLIIFGTLSFIAGGLCVLLPETYKKPLPETIEQSLNFGRNLKSKEHAEGNISEKEHLPLTVDEDKSSDV